MYSVCYVIIYMSCAQCRKYALSLTFENAICVHNTNTHTHGATLQ